LSKVNADSLYSPDGQEKDPVTIPSLYEKGEQQEDSNAISTVVYGTEKQQIDPNALPEPSNEADEVVEYPKSGSFFRTSEYNRPGKSHLLGRADKCVWQAKIALSKLRRPRRLYRQPLSPEWMGRRCKKLFQKWKKTTNLKASSCRAKFFKECQGKLMAFWSYKQLHAGRNAT
jgi:hypothetical protein